jgi:hypothetical protein
VAVTRTSRFAVDPALTQEMLDKRAALITAVRAAFPGLTEARLARAGDDRWVDTWRWESTASMQAAIAGAPALPEAAAAFSLTSDLTAEQAEVVDER